MPNIDIIISGQATKAADSIDTLIDKLNSLSSKLVEVGQNARKAFGEFNSKFDDNSFGGLVNQMNSASEATAEVRTGAKETSREISNAGKAASKSAGLFGSLGKSIGRIAFYRAIRSAIKAVTQAVKEGIENYYKWSKATSGPFAAAMDKLKSSASQMKNQLGAAFGALATAVMPVVNLLVNALTKLAKIITMVFSLLNGRSTYDEAVSGFEDVENAASGAGKAVKGLLAPWDELNVIGQEKGGGGGGGNAQNFESMFENAPIEGWLKDLFDVSGIPESIERIKKTWEAFVDAVKNGEFAFGINTFILDPLRTVIDTLDGVLLLLRGIMSGDLWVVGVSIFKLVFDSIINTVIVPFTRTIDAIFGTDLTGAVLGFKDHVDNIISDDKALPPWHTFTKQISGLFSDAWNKVKGIWEKVATWFKDKVITPIKNFFAPIKDWLGTLFSGAWKIIKGVWILVSGWFRGNVITPLKKAWTLAIDAIKKVINALWDKIKKPALTFLLWIIENIAEPIATAFATAIDGIRKVYVKIKNAIVKSLLSAYNWMVEKIINPSIKAWNKVGSAIAKATGQEWTDLKELPTVSQEAFDALSDDIDSLADKVKDDFAAIKKDIKNAINQTGKINFKYSNTNATVTVTAKLASGTGDTLQGSNLGTLNVQNVNVTAKASGGYVSSGQLFVAREAGPELVGSIGSQTAVANNDQIVAGIQSGVAQANSEQNALLRQQNSILMQLLNKELVISPSVALGQVVARSNALYARS